MCGICISVFFRIKGKKGFSYTDASLEEILEKLSRRGPDHIKRIAKSFKSFKNVIDLKFISSVLHMRGSSAIHQPLCDDSGNLLMWNGEVFYGPFAHDSISDTEILALNLFKCKEPSEVINVIQDVKGPFAFVFYQKNGLLWFGRDIFGRRSLLWSADDSNFNVCSVSYGDYNWYEVPADGIYCLDLRDSYERSNFIVLHYCWSSLASGSMTQSDDSGKVPKTIVVLKNTNLCVTIPLDKPLNKSLICNELIHENGKPSGPWDLPTEASKITLQDSSPNAIFSKYSTSSLFRENVLELEKVLSKAVERRVKNQLQVCKKCYSDISSLSVESCEHSSVGVLFSGGLDSIVIACLVERHLPKQIPIDLINVAFASNSCLTNADGTNVGSAFFTPDRVTGKTGVESLRNLFPDRKWNFVEVNVSEEELVQQRKERIRGLLHPSCTVLDDSIGCALWFAARGQGYIMEDGQYTPYQSPVRVLLIGMGADEQFAGYSRHRAKFNSGGLESLVEELALELDRIGSRNLGRDDRIITDNGIESRYPFLDEDVVSFLNSLPVWLKADLTLPRGIGEKLLLRLLAFKLGLKEAAALPKRAIQFGSRIARIENSKEKGSDVCERLAKVRM